MRVVVTRPTHSGEQTARILRERGHEPVLLPLSRAVHDPAAVRAALAKHAGAIAVTSAEAIRSAAELGTELSPYLARRLFAVGRATAQEAARTGFTAVSTPEGDGRALGEFVSTALGHSGSELPVVYLAGLPRASGFEARLQELQVPFVVAECYYMVEVEHEHEHLRQMFLAEPVGAVLLYSRENAERFFRLSFFRSNSDVLDGSRILCLSAAVAAAVPDHLRRNISIAATPEEESLLALLGSA